VLCFFICAIFPRYTWENRTQEIGKRHAAAGKKGGSVLRKNASAYILSILTLGHACQLLIARNNGCH